MWDRFKCSVESDHSALQDQALIHEYILQITLASHRGYICTGSCVKISALALERDVTKLTCLPAIPGRQLFIRQIPSLLNWRGNNVSEADGKIGSVSISPEVSKAVYIGSAFYPLTASSIFIEELISSFCGMILKFPLVQQKLWLFSKPNK